MHHNRSPTSGRGILSFGRGGGEGRSTGKVVGRNGRYIQAEEKVWAGEGGEKEYKPLV